MPQVSLFITEQVSLSPGPFALEKLRTQGTDALLGPLPGLSQESLSPGVHV